MHKLVSSLFAMTLAVSVAQADPDRSAINLARETPQVTRLKAEIFALADSYRGEPDPDGSKQNALNEKIALLLKRTPRVPQSEKLRRISGVWEQVWGPYTYPGSGSVHIDPAYAYQVVYPEGYYYNITRSRYSGRDVTAFLRGEYQAVGGGLRVHFTRNVFFVNGWIPEDISLVDVGRLAESGVINGPDVPIGRGPGPMDQPPGLLQEKYIDSDLRIAYGSREGEDSRFADLYVLRRVPTSSH